MIPSAEQIRAARAMLNWSQETLAEESGLSLATIYNLEKGHLSPRSSSEIRKTFEGKGVEFIGAHGVSRRAVEYDAYAGPEGTERFYADLLSVAKQTDREFVMHFKTQEKLAQALGAEPKGNLERLEELSKSVKVHCLLSDIANSGVFIPHFQFRATATQAVGAYSLVVYGNKSAIISWSGVFAYVVFGSAEMARGNYNSFLPAWKAGVPIIGVSPSRS